MGLLDKFLYNRIHKRLHRKKLCECYRNHSLLKPKNNHPRAITDVDTLKKKYSSSSETTQQYTASIPKLRFVLQDTKVATTNLVLTRLHQQKGFSNISTGLGKLRMKVSRV